MGRDKLNELDRLLDEVARGQRRLKSVHDPRLRDAIRVALRIHAVGPAAPDTYARLRMRVRVLSRLDPRGPSLLDHAWTALEVFSRPAPYIVRGVALAAVLVFVGLGASVTAADTLPDDVLYPLKLASEQVRLELAVAPDDRASVELSIADHRLAEAEKLAIGGRTSDALVASAMYSQHVALSAAELAPNETSAVAQQLESTFTQQRDHAGTLASTLSTSTQSAAAAEILATIANPTVAPGLTVAVRVADTAAGVAQQLAAVAEHGRNASPVPTARAFEPPATHQTTVPTAAATRAAQTGERKASEVLQTVRKAAENAKAAADRARSHK